MKRKIVHSIKAMKSRLRPLWSALFSTIRSDFGSPPMLLAHLTGCSLYYASDVDSPGPVVSRHPGLFSTAESPGEISKVSHCKASASSSSGSLVPGAPPRPLLPDREQAAPKVGFSRRSGGRREKGAPLSPGRKRGGREHFLLCS